MGGWGVFWVGGDVGGDAEAGVCSSSEGQSPSASGGKYRGWAGEGLDFVGRKRGVILVVGDDLCFDVVVYAFTAGAAVGFQSGGDWVDIRGVESGDVGEPDGGGQLGRCGGVAEAVVGRAGGVDGGVGRVVDARSGTDVGDVGAGVDGDWVCQYGGDIAFFGGVGGAAARGDGVGDRVWGGEYVVVVGLFDGERGGRVVVDPV